MGNHLPFVGFTYSNSSSSSEDEESERSHSLSSKTAEQSSSSSSSSLLVEQQQQQQQLEQQLRSERARSAELEASLLLSQDENDQLAYEHKQLQSKHLKNNEGDLPS